MIYRQICEPILTYQTNNIYNGASFQHSTLLAQQTFAKDRESIRINYSTLSHNYATPIYYSLRLSSDYISYLLNLFYPDTASYYFLRKQLYRFLEQEHLLINQDAVVSLPYSLKTDPPLAPIVYRWCSIIPNDSIPLIYLNSTNFYYYLIFDNSILADNRQFTRQIPFALSHFTGYTTLPTPDPLSTSSRLNYFLQILHSLRYTPTIADAVHSALSSNTDLRLWFDSSFLPLYTTLPPEDQFTINSPQHKMLRYYFSHPFHQASNEPIYPNVDLSSLLSISITKQTNIRYYPNNPTRSDSYTRCYTNTPNISCLTHLKLRHQLYEVDNVVLQKPLIDLFNPIPLATKINDEINLNAAMLYPVV